MSDFLEKLEKGIDCSSAEATRAVAKELAAHLPEDCTLALHGDLGVGKTTFVGGLAEAWNIKEPITSPTFNLLACYKGKRTLLHLDAYRLESEADAESLFLDDLLVSPFCFVVEWPQKIEGMLHEPLWNIELSIQGEGIHRVTLLKT